MLRAAAVVALSTVATAAAAPDDYLSRLPAIVNHRLDEMVAARAPKLTPPTPLAVTWKAIRIGSIDVGAPLVAFVAADLDGDAKTELYAVTSREVVAISLKGRPAEIGRVAFSGERAVPAPRDVVGTAAVEGNELVARSSVWTTDLRVSLVKGKLVAKPGGTGFLACPGERMQLVPGRNYFAGDLHGVRCRQGLTDRAGVPLDLRAQLAVGGKLAVEVKKCAPGGACQAAGTFEYGHSGTAFELADVDRDGTPEVIISGYVAPGDADGVKVHELGGDEKKPVFRRNFNGGVVGIAVAQTTVVVAVRLAGSTRVDLWRLN
jgi:hypothetical protein